MEQFLGGGHSYNFPSEERRRHLALNNAALSDNGLVYIYDSDDLEQAGVEYADRFKLIESITTTVTATEGSNEVTLTGASFLGTFKDIWVGDVMVIDGSARKYQIRNFGTSSKLYLEEPILAGDVVAGTTVEVQFFRVEWITFLLHPNEYTRTVIARPGHSFMGVDKRTVLMSEVSSSPYTTFINWGLNSIQNISLAPTTGWSSLDAGFSPTEGANGNSLLPDDYETWHVPSHWAGQLSLIENCLLDMTNKGGAHGGGNPSFPLIPGGRSIVKGCHVWNESPNSVSAAVLGDGEIDYEATSGNSFVDYVDTEFELVDGFEHTDATSPPLSGIILCNEPGTYNIHNCRLKTRRDLGHLPASLGVYGIGIYNGTRTDIKVNVSHTDINLTNTSGNAGQNTMGVMAYSDGEININNSNIEVDGTVPEAIKCNDANATINVRRTRLKSTGTNAVNCAAGTVHLDNSTTADIIGAVTGVGANINSPKIGRAHF